MPEPIDSEPGLMQRELHRESVKDDRELAATFTKALSDPAWQPLSPRGVAETLRNTLVSNANTVASLQSGLATAEARIAELKRERDEALAAGERQHEADLNHKHQLAARAEKAEHEEHLARQRAEAKYEEAVQAVNDWMIKAGEQSQARERAEAREAKMREALERIDALDQASGYDVTERDAFTAIRIARTALNPKPE